MTVAEVERIGAPAISPQDARKAFLEYRRAVMGESDDRRRKEYRALMQGYKAIMNGQSVLDLQKVVSTAGLQHDTLYPRLAVARADQKFCFVDMQSSGAARFQARMHGDRWGRGGLAASLTVDFPPGTFQAYHWRQHPTEKYQPGRVLADGTVNWGWASRAMAMVPLVPPQLHPRRLENYHILWDAVWQKAPPKDPLLLKHLAGALYAVVAHWDLSPLEQAVLRGRLS